MIAIAPEMHHNTKILRTATIMAAVCALLAVPRPSSAVQDLLLVEAQPGSRPDAGYSVTGWPATQLVPALNARNTELAARFGLDRWYVAEGAPLSVLEARYRRAPNVLRVHRSSPVRLARIPNDPLFSQQWALRNTGSPSGKAGADIGATSAWDTTTGSPTVTVAVIDTGVYAGHPDIAANIVPGYNFVDKSTNTDDQQGHGTNCAGIIGAIGNNSLDIAGIAWNCKIMPVKVVGLDANGNAYGLDLWLAQGIIWAADHGARVLSISLVSDNAVPVVRAAVDYAIALGATVVAAAGNDSKEIIRYPAAYPGVIAVGASDQWDQRASFSNWGSSLDVVAPGVQITTLTRTGGTWGFFGGTSAATPHVAGICALVLSVDPSTTPDRMKDLIRQGADDIAPYGFDAYTGCGRASARATLAALTDPTPPTPPSVTDQGSFTDDPTSLTFTWTASSDPESGVTGYEYAIGEPGNPTGARGWSAAGTSLALTATGLSLQANRTYVVSVRAINGVRARSAPGESDGIVVAPRLPDIGAAFAHSNGDYVTLDGKVATASFTERTWIAEPGFGPAIAVQPPVACVPGDRLRVTGQIATVSGIRTVTDAVCTVTGAGNPPSPLSMRQSALGGLCVNPDTPGIPGSSGPYNIGRLVSIRGRVTEVHEGGGYVDDGSGLSGFGRQSGCLVTGTNITIPPVGSFVAVTGIVEPETVNCVTKPVVRIRAQSDVSLILDPG